MKTIFEQLVEQCERHLEAYRDDLMVHDRKNLEKNPGVPFLHWTRPTGTTLALMVGPEDYPAKGEQVPYLFGTADREHILKSVRVVAYASFQDSRHLLALHFDGEKLRPVSAKTVGRIIDEYESKVRAAWAAPRKVA